ncbi:hypothetical protein C5167_047834 [Papaver somniferum]|uniref:Membrane-associated kinase regulator 2 n=1 Tax=Papaver somniferum TaxID=3469 RepID=A0A4Y7LK95_PAPSO|nr:probable membrane-associated kinase regulator 2 [Papaver somniferum]RZC85050.1 hypothetical protein C5167_047834 [Papaver somniferum]
MEAFSLLKYWRVGGSNGVNKTTEKQQQQQPIATTTIATTVSEMSVEDEGEECVVDGDADDEGPFFDLEFTVPDDDEEDNNGGEEEDKDDDGDSVTTVEDGFDFTVSPGSVTSGGNQIDSSPNNLTFSPSDDIFFKGDGGKSVSPLFQSSSSTTSTSSSVESGINNNPKVQFPVSLIKTATKIRVFMLGLKSNSSNPKPKSDDQKPEEKQSTIRTELKQSRKFVTVKFRVDEILPMISLFTRDTSSSSAASNNNKIMSSSQEEIEVEDEEGRKLISKDVVQKYLKMIKPLYVRVSKRYNNNGGAFSPLQPKIEIDESLSSKRKQGVSNLPNGLRIVRKHLGKSRSASSVNPVTTNSSSSGGVQSKRRDDSLLQQQDGIQSAILHCKRSFNSSRDTDSCPRSSTESHEISTRTSIDEAAAGK